MFNDTMKISVMQAAKSLGKDEAYVFNNFNIVHRFKLLEQNVEIVASTSDHSGYELDIINTEPYRSWENTPIILLNDKMVSNYNPDKRVMLSMKHVTTDDIDDILRDNKSTYIGSTYKGKHESDQYLGLIPIREMKVSIDVTPGIFR